MLDRWLVGPAIQVVADALRSAPRGPVAVIEHPRLARGLAERGQAVVVVDAEARALRKLPGGATAVRARGDVLPFAAHSLAAVVGWGAGTRPDWGEVLAEWSRTLVDGGLLVMVDRAPSTELSRRALCGGLAELQQRPAGRLVVTSGIVSAL